MSAAVPSSMTAITITTPGGPEVLQPRAHPVPEAAAGAGLGVLRLVGRGDLSAGLPPALAAAMLAEDLAPRLGFDAPDAG